jgi:hypothetical protein
MIYYLLQLILIDQNLTGLDIHIDLSNLTKLASTGQRQMDRYSPTQMLLADDQMRLISTESGTGFSQQQAVYLLAGDKR